MTRITRICKLNTGKIISRTANILKESIIPVQFKPEASMHHQSCKKICNTTLDSLPLTKIQENPATSFSPCSPFLGDFRWYADVRRQSGRSEGGTKVRKGMAEKKTENKEFDGVIYKSMKKTLNEYRDILIEQAKQNNKTKPTRQAP
ncbi:hypothetical protein HF086_011599 [Spodoptera exigua]|uniref:Uncharacterized protein n=1 Tax=Spodoptera exigua TaxID=7107 RepID=A0A922SEJ2_SPOEX|nr:hypothetical protein HF086_011599 [Spodoptera exigua]